MSLEVHEFSSLFILLCYVPSSHIIICHLFLKDVVFFLSSSLGTKVTFQEHPKQVFATKHILFGNSVIFEQEIRSFCPQSGEAG